MAVEALLSAEAGQAARLRHIAVIGGDQHDLQVEAAQPNNPTDVIEADSGPTRFPACHDRLHGARTLGQFTLSQRGTLARFPDKVAAVATHLSIIADLLYSRAPGADGESRLCRAAVGRLPAGQPWSPSIMTAAEIEDVTNELDGLCATPDAANPAERAEVHVSLDLSLEWDPHVHQVTATVDLSRVAGCVRGGT